MEGFGSVPAVVGQWMQGLYLDNAVQCEVRLDMIMEFLRVQL